MKLSIKSVIRSSYPHFQCFDDQQLLFRAGNTLCIKTLGKQDSDFIFLDKNMHKLYAYKPFTNKKGVFTAQKINKQIYIASYSLKNQRKAIQLAEQPSFIADVEKIQLLSDQYDNSLVYGVAKSKETACIFLADFNKLKLLAVGYLPPFEDLKVDGRQNMRLSVCGHNGSHNYVKMLQYVSGQWQITEQPIKKIHNPIFQHELLLGSRMLAVTNTSVYVLQDNEVIKTIGLDQGSNISEIIKIPRGLLVRLRNDVLKLMVEDADEISFVMSNTVNLALQANDKIETIRLSNNNEEVWLRTARKNVYVWRCDNIGLQLSSLDLVFSKVDMSSSSQDTQGNVSISTGKKYALLTGSNSITLWSIQQNQCVLSSDFLDPNDPNKRTLFAGAINPDGNSLILAFEDKIKIFQILFTKFKQINQLQIKRCQNVIYSHGGQLVACRYGRGINSSIVVINLLRFCEVCTFKVQSDPSQILWNELDDQLIVSVESSSIHTYKISEQARVSNVKLNGAIVHTRLDYKSRKLIVSTDENIYMLQNGKIIETMAHPFTDFYYLFPLYGIYFIAGKSGTLYWSSHIKFENFNQLPIFSRRTFNLICRSGFLLAYSSFQDITVLRVSRNLEKKSDASQKIVMIEKDEILNLFQKVKAIQSNYQMLTAATTMKLEEERQSYEQAISQIRNNFSNQLIFANSKFLDISVQKLKQEKQSEKFFEVIEVGQSRNLAQLQKMYERKIELQREKYMNMQQRFLEYKIESERKILQLQSRFSRQVSQIRQEYSHKSKEEAQLVDKQKERHLVDRKRVQLKLLQLEEENEIVLTDLQKSKDVIIGQLRMQLKLLQEQNQKHLSQLQTKSENLKQYQFKAQLNQRQLKRLVQSLQQAENRVKLLEREIERRNHMIDERDQIIVEQGQQIGGLQKAKYVLSFRTTEIRKELEPKESLIDKLKSQLFKLDQEFKVQKKKNFQLSQKLQKVDAVISIAKREISDLKITLKCKERANDQLCSQIFMVINTIDPKDWNAQFVKIYQNYIKQEKHKNRRDKKKDDTVEQINRHLVHVQQSLVQVTAGTDRLIKGKDKEVVRKMKQNSDLVYELNVMRKKENQFHKEKRELVNENARLKREAGDSIKTTTRAHTANTGFTRRVIPSRQLNSRDRTTLDISSDLNISKRQMKQLKKEKSRLTSARRTLMVQDDIKQKSGKFFDLAKQLQTARNTIKRQDRMIQQLNHRLLGSPQIYESGNQ